MGVRKVYGRQNRSEVTPRGVGWRPIALPLWIWFDARPGLAFLMEYPANQQRDCGTLSEPPLSPNLTVRVVVLAPK